MSKEMISAKPGALLKAAKQKGYLSLQAISEATGKDRKTLREVEQGNPIKKTTLMAIATKLRVPVEHFIDQGERVVDAQDRRQRTKRIEIVLRPLTAEIIREMLEQMSSPIAGVQWKLSINRVNSEVESQLLKFQQVIDGWMNLLNAWDEWGSGKAESLQGQLEKIKTAEDVDDRIKALQAADVKLFGECGVAWRILDDEDYMQGPYEQPRSIPNGNRFYESCIIPLIAIEKKSATSSRFLFQPGDVPPQSFSDDDQPNFVKTVHVDGVLVWSRRKLREDDEVPF